MKKYLMIGFAALAFAACSNNDDAFDANRSIVKDTYNAAFVKYVGGNISPNQTWGFGANATRSVIKQDMTDYPSATAPAAITQKEAEWVTEWFQNNPGLTEEGQPFTNFYVQFVSGDQTNKQGVWHRYDQNRVNNGYDSNYWDEDFTDNGGMDKLHVGATRSQSATDHLKDFNAKTGGPWDVVYVKNGSALQFGYHSSWGEDSKSPDEDGYYWFFKMVELEVPGSCFDDGVARKGWYVGLSLYGKKYDNGDKELGVQRLQYAEDWILKVVPDNSNTIRVIAEDLSASDATDFDFNDVVFDVEYTSDTEAQVTLKAAGGTLPLTVDGHEVHAAFGITDTKTMINTNAGRILTEELKKQGYKAADGLTAQPFTVSGINKANWGSDIKVMVEKGGQWYTIDAVTGGPTAKICVRPNFQWPNEKQSIKAMYEKFQQWVTNPSVKWYYED